MSCRRAASRSARPVDDRVGERLELLAADRAVEAALAPLASVVEGGLAGALERAGRGDARRARPRAARPRAPARTASSSRAASRSGIVGVPSRRSVPGIFPVSIVSPAQSRMSSTIWNAIPSEPRRTRALPPPSTHAASNSLPVLSAQRSRYASTSCRVAALATLERLAARERERRVGECATARPTRSAASSRRRARRGSRPRPRAAPGRTPSRRRRVLGARGRRRRGRRGRASPCGRARPRPRRRPVAAHPRARRGSVSSGRRRLPPAASASAPTAATMPGCASTTAARRVSTSARYPARPSRRSSRRARSPASPFGRGAHGVAEATPDEARRSSRRAAGIAPRSNPRRSISAASSSAPGNRRTLAGRYVYALPPGSTLAEQRHDAVEPEREERPQEPARLGDLEDREPAAGPQHAAELARAPRSRSATLRTPKPTVAASNAPSSKGSASRSPCTHSTVADLRRARSSIAGEKSRPVTTPPSPLGGDREVARAAARVEHAVAGLDDRLRP